VSGVIVVICTGVGCGDLDWMMKIGQVALFLNHAYIIQAACDNTAVYTQPDEEIHIAGSLYVCSQSLHDPISPVSFF
jgi:hypothetical protein